MRTETFLSFKYLFRGRAKHVSFISVISCIGVSLGVATLIIVTSVMEGFDNDLMEKLLRFNDHITVESLNRNFNPESIRAVEKIKNVQGASLFLQTQVFAKVDKYIVPLVVKGIDLESSYGSSKFSKYIIEDYKKPGFFVGQGLYQKFFLSEKIEYYPLKKKLKSQVADVRGVFKIGLYDIDNGFLISDIETTKSLSDNYLLFLGINVEDPFNLSQVKEKIEDIFGPGYYVTDWTETNELLFSALKLEKFAMFIILSLIVVVASFNIFATLTVKVVEKTKDIGILKTLGVTNREILSIFTFQGMLLGIIGVIFGLGLGVSLCYLLKEYQFIKLPQEIYYIDYLPVAVRVKDVVIIAITGVLISFFSSIFPAVRAAKMNPCEALRYE